MHYRFNPATPPADLPVLCARCEEAILGEPVIRECEANAPYCPPLYCTQECAQLANEDQFEHAYSERS